MIVCVGDVLVDVVVSPAGPVAVGSDTPSTITWRQGGAAANTAAWLAASGTPVRLVGRIGDDLAGTAVVGALDGLGVQLRLAVDPDRATGTVVAVTRPDDRDMYTSRGAAAALSPDDLVEGWLDGVAHLHLSGYALLSPDTRAAGRAALAAAADAGVAISVDPASAEPLREVGDGAFLRWLPPGTLLTPNLAEATVLTGLVDPEAAAIGLAQVTGEAIVTLGADGAVWSDGAVTADVAADPLPGGDPVGAGDAFTAGLLAARHAGVDVAAQLAAATACAATAVGGGRPGDSVTR